MRSRAIVAFVLVLGLLPASRALAGGRVVADVIYTGDSAPRLALDIYLPAGNGPFPSVLMIHGGGWKKGDKADMAGISADLAGEGFLVFTPNYRLAPPGGSSHFPDPLMDLRIALEWVRQNAATYHGSGAKVGVVGSSSGANLAGMLGTVGIAGSTRADVVVSWSGGMDLPVNQNGTRKNYLGCAYDACPATWMDASPISHVDPGEAPFYLTNSEGDTVVHVEEARNMQAALQQAGVPNRLDVVAGSCHAKNCLVRYPELWTATVAWLNQYL